MKRTISLLFLFLILALNKLQAHTMWIEVSNVGKKGEAQQIKVFFGDFSWEKPTATAKWFSNIKDYQLIMKTPKGEIVTLQDHVQDSMFYTHTFTPTEDGVYTFWLIHEVRDVYKDKKLTYSSAAFVNIGKKQKVLLGNGISQLEIKNTQKPNEIIYWLNGKPAVNEVVTIVPANNKDATLTLTTDAKGRLTFPKDWKGAYLIEIADSKKVTTAMHSDKEYQFDFKEFTYRITL